MLFQSKVPSVLSAVLGAARVQSAVSRKEDAQKRLDYYHDQQLDYIKAELNNQFADPSKLTPAFVNIVRKVTNALAQVYREEPKRDIDGSDRDKEVFAEIARTSGLSVKMKLASRYTKLLKTIMLRPVWRGGKVDLDVLTPDILDVSTGDTPEDLEAVMVTHYPGSGKTDEVEYSLWTPETFERLDCQGKTIEEEANPYGLIPFIPCWDHMPTDSFWLAGGDDLITLQETINLKLVELLYVLKFQGFGVGWIKGLENAGQIEIGAGIAVQLPENGELGYAATNAPIKDLIEAIEFLIAQAAVSNGLAAHSLSVNPKVESGAARMVSNRELDEMRSDDVALFRQYEHRLFEVMKTVWDVHNPGRRFSEKASLQVDFADPKPETSLKERAEAWERLIGLGVLSPVDAAMERNPDLKTREDALAYLLTVQDEMEQLKEATI